MSLVTSALGPPPLATPITANDADKTGIPFQHRDVARGDLSTFWGQWFNGLKKVVTDIVSYLEFVPKIITTTQANFATDTAALGTGDAGTLVWVSDYGHMVEWTGTAWKRGQGDTDRADTLVFCPNGTPAEFKWHACDGSTVAFFDYANPATLGSRALPNLIATPAYAKGGSSYSSAINAATVPTIGGVTDSATTGITVSPATVSTGTAQSGPDQPVVTALTDGGGTVTDGGHDHALSSANAPITLPADPVANFSCYLVYRQ